MIELPTWKGQYDYLQTVYLRVVDGGLVAQGSSNVVYMS